MRDLASFGIITGQGKPFEEIIYTTALLYNLVSSRIAGYLNKYDLSLGKLNILAILKNQAGKDGMPQVEISKYLIVTPSNMTKMLDKLEKATLVTRGAQEGDRRVNRVKITKRGVTLVDALWEGYEAELKDAVAVLSPTQQKQLAGLLLNWIGKLR